MPLSATRKEAKKSKRRAEAEEKQRAAEVAAAEELRRRAATRLSEWEAEARRRANSLEPGALVWRLCDEAASEALALGCYLELRTICFVAAGRVADVRGLRLTRKHYANRGTAAE